MPLPGIPMVKRETVKDDGRFLNYYTFPPESDEDKSSGGGENVEAGHV